jgi:sulfhydrogenase subunit delta
MGGIQSNRNKLPKKLIDKGSIKNVAMIIKVDYFIPGCPINKEELYRCLMDLYWGRRFTLPDLAVCFECRQNANNCFLKKNKPCLGPITRMGCNSVCLNNGQPCRGCRGIIPQANIEKMMESLHQIVGEEEAENLLSIFGVCR